MAITSYQGKNGEPLWKVAVQARSEIKPSIRIQKAKFGITSEREAAKIDKDLQRECEREVLKKETQGSSWGAVVESFGEYLKSDQARRLNDLTRQEDVATIRKHTQSWWRRPASSIVKSDVRELFASLVAQGFSVGHQKKMKVVINRMFVYGIEYRLIHGIQQSPTVGLQLAREEDAVPEILTLAEIRTLLSSARTLESKWYYHWALALLTGMRSGELYALLWTDIDWENNAITVSKSFSSKHKCIKSTKSGHWRTVPISSELKSLLLEIKAKAGDRANVLPRIWIWTIGLQAGELRKFCKGMGIPSIRFHALRACFATQLIRNGVPPIQIQKICGWKDLKTMQRYIRLAGIEVTGATEVLKVLPPQEIAAKVVNLFTRESVKPQSD